MFILSYQVCGYLLQQPQEPNTVTYMLYVNAFYGKVQDALAYYSTQLKGNICIFYKDPLETQCFNSKV